MSFRMLYEDGGLPARWTGLESVQKGVPAEVLESIFGWLREDRTTLCMLAQICQRWREPAQRVLFYTLEINAAWKLHLVEKLFDDGRSSKFRDYVRELITTLKGYPYATRQWVTTVPMILGPRLPGVKILTLSGLEQKNHDVAVQDFPGFVRSLAVFKKVKDLRLQSCTFKSLQQLGDLALAFPLPLERLHIALVNIIQKKVHNLDCHPKYEKLALKSLSIGRQCPINLLTQWLPFTSSMSTLSALSVPHVCGAEFAQVGGLLCALGSGVTYLRIGLEDTYDIGPDFTNLIQLSLNDNLQHLHINIVDTNENPLSWVMHLLTNVKEHGPCINRISFDIYVQNSQQIQGKMFLQIKQHLEQRVRKRGQDSEQRGRDIDRVTLLLRCNECGGLTLPQLFKAVSGFWTEFIEVRTDKVFLKEAELFSV